MVKVSKKVGDVFQTNEGYNVRIVNYVRNDIVYVEFDDGNVVCVRADNLINGKIKNKNHKGLYGVGYTGYGKYTQKDDKESYIVWCNMLRRCYHTKTQFENPTYIGCSVIEEWHNFQIFTKWYYENYIKCFELDKDLLFSGNKIYSASNCCFLPRELNTAIQTKKNKTTNTPFGVTKHGNRFRTTKNNTSNILISFGTIDEAILHHKQTKEEYVNILINKYEDKLHNKSLEALKLWKI